MKNLISPLKNNRGVAILVALFAMVFMLFIATQVSYDTQVDFVASAQQVNDLKAFYAAKAGVELSLFRIALYQKVRAAMDAQMGDPQMQAMINQIWQFPFAWPPVVPDNMNAVEKDKVNRAVKESYLDSQYTVTITAEGGKIDLNDLGSEIEELSEAAKNALLQIFKNEVENNEAFADKYENESFEEVINNIADWVDGDSDGRNARAESSGYEPPEDSNFAFPPNRALRTIDELHMVAGVNEDFFRLLKDRVTVHGTKGINPNEASRKVLEGLLPDIDEEALTKVLERRSSIEKGGPFKNDEDFFGFLDSVRYRTDRIREAKLPLYYNAVYNFRIISTGKSVNTRKEITAVTFDFENLSERYKTWLNAKVTPTQPGQPPPPTTATPSPSPVPFKSPKGRPTVVYWEET